MSSGTSSFAIRATRLGACLVAFGFAAHCSSSSSKGPPTTSTVIGLQGGTIQSADGVFDLVIPAGAIASDVTLSVISQTSPPAGAVGTAYTVSPFTVSLQAPAKVVFHYNLASLADASPSTLVAGIYTGTWGELSEPLYVPESQTISGTTQELSLFGLIPSPLPVDSGVVEDAGPVDDDAAGGCNGTLTAAVGSSDCTVSEICLNQNKYEIDCDPLSGSCTCSVNGADTAMPDASCSDLGASSLALCGFPVGNISATSTAGGDAGSTCTFDVFPFEDAGPDGGGTCGVTETCGVADRYQLICDGAGSCQCSDNGVAGPSVKASCTGLTSSSITKCFYPGP